MIILRIEHRISNFEEWRKAFDSDPLNRKKSGVKRYRIFRPTDDSNFVIIDLEFDNPDEANAMRTSLQNMWKNIEGKMIFSPKIILLDIVESEGL